MRNRLIPGVVHDQTLTVLKSEDSVQRAVDLMSTLNIGAVLVIDGENALKGIFTERDLMTRVVAIGLSAQETRLDSVLTEQPDTLSPSNSIRDALRLMHEGNYRHLPIVDETQLVGIVSIKDLYAAITTDLEQDLLELANHLIGSYINE